MKIRFRDILNISRTAFKKWKSKDPFRESAVIAYYSIFSLPGLFIIIVTLMGYFFGRPSAINHITAQISETFGSNTAEQIKDMITKASEMKNTLIPAIIGVVTIIFGATGVLAQFQKSLNIIWEVKSDKFKFGIWNLVRVRLFSFGLIVAIAFILVVSLIVSALLTAFGNWMSNHISSSFFLILMFINSIFSIIVLALIFGLMFKYFPDAEIKWRHVSIGAIVTAILFEIGKFGLGLYFGNTNPATNYGAAGSIILIMLWVSYSSMIVFYGAEFTHAYAIVRSGKIPPSPMARERT
jgi:membrane protein